MAEQRPSSAGGLRLAELVAGLSLGIDLGFGQPMEHILRQCLIALRLGERLGLDDDDRSALYYTALLVNVGCHSDAHEQAKWFGDDIVLKSGKYDHEQRGLADAVAMVRQLGRGNPPLHRFRVGLEFAVSGYRQVEHMIEQHADLARGLAEQLGLPERVYRAVGATYERWDGKGWPGVLEGGKIPIAARVAQFAEYMEVAHRVGGVDAAVAMARKRAGSQFDPGLVATFAADVADIVRDLDTGQTWHMVIDAEPGLCVTVDHDSFDQALTAVADFVDLKSPFTLGHGRAVAARASAAGRRLGLPEDDVRLLTRAGLVHGFGRLGVSNAIWDKAGPLGAGEWERIRLAPYLTQRMLRQSAVLAPIGAIAGQHRERLDGSGYPQALAGAALSQPARILAAAEAYQSMCEPRPHRLALTDEVAAKTLRAEARQGRLDTDAVDAVLASAGHAVPRRRDGVGGLTAREIEVLQLLARGHSNKSIASQLSISTKTARNHVEHIYTKTGANNRVTASLYAVQHGLLPEDGATAP